MELEIIHTNKNGHHQFVLLSENKKELCRFNNLSDASLVFRFLNGSQMTEHAQNMAYSLLVDMENSLYK